MHVQPGRGLLQQKLHLQHDAWLNHMGGVTGVKASASTMRKGTTKISGKEDILAQLEAQRAKQAEQLKVEAQARQELEDMLLRIERHFKVCRSMLNFQELDQLRSQASALSTDKATP